MKDRVGSMTIIVADQPVQEYEGDGKVYIEMDLQAKTSYDCEYKDDTPHGEEVSKWPVTPYTVQAKNHSGSSHYWCELHLDGAFVKQELLNPGQTKTFTGFSDNGSTREFLFALPRYQRTTDGDEVVSGRLRKIGAIECRFLQATYSHQEQQWSGGSGGGGGSGGEAFRQANKIEAAKIAKQRGQEDGGKDTMTGTTRAGRAVGGGGGKASAPAYKNYAIWNKGSLDSECCVHYRQKHILKQMGVIPEEAAVQADEAFADLAVSAKSVLGKDWQSLVPHFVELARTYNLPEMPAVDGRNVGRTYAPTSTLPANIVKFNLGESRCAVPMGDAAARAAQQATLKARLGGAATALCSVIDDHQQLFSAASVALFGCEDLYMMVRAVAASEVESNPERYTKAPRLLADLRDFGRPVDADAALVALANATGVHFALHVASDGGTPHAFRPDGYAGPSAGAPAYVLCRLPGKDLYGLHVAAVDATKAAERAARKAVKLVNKEGAKKKRARQEAICLD